MDRRDSIAAIARIAALGGVALAAPTAARAGSLQTSMGVSATVTANCSITALPVAFGDINPLAGTAFTANGSVTVTCTNGSTWSVTADAGGGSGATLTTRRMTFSGNTLNYALYTDSGYANVWGSGTGGTAAVSGSGTGSAQTFTVYGRIPAGQTAARAGGYSDTVNITITY